VVLSFDRDERRIALGIKQIESNPWEDFEREMPVGTRTTGTSSRLIDKGVIIELPHGIEGFLPNSQISRKYFDGKKRTLQVGDVLNIIVVEFDKEERKVILSNSQAEKKEEAAASAPHSESKGGGKTATLADTLPEDSPLLKAMKKAEVEEAKEKKAKTPKKKTKEEKPKAEKTEGKKASKAVAESETEVPAKPKAKKKEAAKEKTPAETEPKPEPKAKEKAKEKADEEKTDKAAPENKE
jgi:ribosomal protein S1